MNPQLLGQLAYIGIPAFVLGVAVGWFSETRKGLVMAYTGSARSWFDRNVALLYMVVAVLALIGITVATAATITNGRQDAERSAENKARDQQTSALLDCFDEYAAASATTSKAVREASVVVADATTARDEALQTLLDYIATEPIDGTTRGAALFATVLKTNASLVQAQADLAQVREDNPVPSEPSSFCLVKP